CGAPVGVPSLQPTGRGATLGPMSPAERLQARLVARSVSLSSPDAPSAEVVAPPSFDRSDSSPDNVLVQHLRLRLAIGLVRQLTRRRWRPAEMERHWYQCLFFPIRAWPLVLGLAIVLTGLSGGIALALPSLLSDSRAEGSWLLSACLSCLPALLILGYASGF